MSRLDNGLYDHSSDHTHPSHLHLVPEWESSAASQGLGVLAHGLVTALPCPLNSGKETPCLYGGPSGLLSGRAGAGHRQ